MRIPKIISLLVLTLIISSCSSTKKNTDESLYATTWELEQLSDSQLVFSELYTDRKPSITFDKTANTVKGTSSCNGYSANYTLDNDKISFGEPGPSTKMYCGEGETVFLNTLQKVNTYEIDTDGKLNLMINDMPIMRFKKTTKQ